MTDTFPGYSGRTTSIAKRLADMVRERGIESGTVSLSIARKVDPAIRVGDRLPIAGAELLVKP